MCTYVLAGSSPVSRTSGAVDFQRLQPSFWPKYPNRTQTVPKRDFLIRNRIILSSGLFQANFVDKILHLLSAVITHGLNHMTITIQREGS